MPEAKWNEINCQLPTAIYEWLAQHAIYQHEGWQRQDGTFAPARPWTDAAIAETDIVGIFQLEYHRHNGNWQRAWLTTVERLGQGFQDMIADERWEWDRDTVRSDGSIVDSPRDIRDTDELIDSQIISFE